MSRFPMKRRIESLRSSRQFPLNVFFVKPCSRMLDYLKMNKEATVLFLIYIGIAFFSLLNSQTVIYFDKQHVSWNSLFIRTVIDSLQFIKFKNNFLLADVFPSNDLC
jgi:hypothetical protein